MGPQDWFQVTVTQKHCDVIGKVKTLTGVERLIAALRQQEEFLLASEPAPTAHSGHGHCTAASSAGESSEAVALPETTAIIYLT